MSTPSLSTAADGISPAFPITDEDFQIWYTQAVTRINIDGVQPPILNNASGYTDAMSIQNKWFPWIDEKIVEPKYDGVCVYLGVPSNQPTHVKDYHVISLMRAVDYLLQPMYDSYIVATVTPVGPNGPPLGNSGS